MTEYNILIKGHSLDILKDDYYSLSKELNMSLSLFYDKFISQNKEKNLYNEINFNLDITKGINTIILTWGAINKKGNYNLNIPELKNSKITKVNIKQILKNYYNYSSEQIDMFIKIYDMLGKKLTINKENNIKMIGSLYLSDQDSQLYKELLSEKLPIYDLYNLSILSFK